MNDFFVTTDKYGSLEYDEIFLYYDGPCIFSVKNKLGYRFICLLESETHEFDRYIVAPVSVERYIDFVRNNWPIRHIFTKSEQGGVFTVSFRKGSVIIQDVDIMEIENMNLPDDNEMLEYDGGYTVNEILLKSAEQNVAILQKSLEKDGEHRQYIYADELGKESSQFQKVFDGIASDEIRQLDNPSKDLINEYKMMARVPIYTHYPASFGVQIEGASLTKIGDEESGFTKYLKIYFELLNINNDASEEYFERHKDALIGLRRYYKTLLALGFDVRMKAATPKHEYFNLRMVRNDILNRYNFLNVIAQNDVEQLELVGTWAQINIEKKTFQFRINTGNIINGKFDDDFEESVFDFYKEIKILVDKKKEIGRMNDESEKYTLLSIISD